MADNNKLIIKTESFPGVDLSVVDLTLVSSVKVGITIVKKVMYKKWGKTFIGVRDQLDAGDVIQVGSLGLKYKVQKLVQLTDREGYIYRVRRVDDANTTQLDIDAIVLKDKVRIVSRKTFEQLMNYACSQRQSISIPTTVDENCTEVCYTKSPATINGNPAAPPYTNTCMQYNIIIPGGVGDRFLRFMNCQGQFEESVLPDSKSDSQVIICTLDINQNTYGGFTPGDIVENGEC